MLSTGLTVFLQAVFCALGFWALLLASAAANRAADSHRAVARELGKVLAQRGEISGHGSALDNLTAQLQKLRGQFFAFKQSVEDGPADDPDPDDAEAEGIRHGRSLPRTLASFTAAPFCENYGRAQVEGPGSKAALCECAYCTEMRFRRDLARRELLPKTANEQAQRTREMADGQ